MALGIVPGGEPEVVIVEGTWWRAERTAWRLGLLTDVRELAFPDMFAGTYQGRRIVYCCAYGAPRTVEVIHMFSRMGARLVVQIGTCGGLQPFLKPGDIVIPDTALADEGIAQFYGFSGQVPTSAYWSDEAGAYLKERGITTHRGQHVTMLSLFVQSPEMCAAWQGAGYLSVDMETATTAAVARSFGVEAVSLLVVWDTLFSDRTFLDPLNEIEKEALDLGNAAVFDAALWMAQSLDKGESQIHQA